MRKTFLLPEGTYINKVKFTQIIALPIKTRNYIKYDDLLIVLYSNNELNKYASENPYRNVWCYNEFGNLHWKIQDTKDIFLLIKYDEKSRSVLVESQTKVRIVDIKTGKVRFLKNVQNYSLVQKRPKIT